MLTELFKDKSERKKIMMYVDYDKKNMVFYTNIYFPNNKYVLKTPLASMGQEVSFDDYKIEKFDLFKYSYLLYY